jgi:signal transduction histidine kinase
VIVVSKDLEIVYANNAAQRLTHPERLGRGRPLPEAWHGFSLLQYAERLFKPGVAGDEFVQPDPERTFLVSGIPSRRSATSAILIEDVSARERRRRAEREFVANAAHELLTPLTGIVGAAHVLEAGAKEVPEDRDKFIGHIARECERLAGIARALLVLARAQSGEHPPRLEVLSLPRLLDETLAIATAESSAEVSVACPDDLTVFVDRDLFVQALVNLATNAAKHGTGSLHVNARGQDSGRVTIDVVDESARVSADDVEQMKRRFYASAGRDSGGFGLGLSIARQSVEALGGTMTLEPLGPAGLRARIDVPAGSRSRR